MREQSIDIRGQRCTIQVYPMGKTVWLAVGEYTGERVRTTGKTALKAAQAWRRAAELKAPAASVGAPATMKAPN